MPEDYRIYNLKNKNEKGKTTIKNFKFQYIVFTFKILIFTFI